MGAFGLNEKDMYRWYWYELKAIHEGAEFVVETHPHDIGEYYVLTSVDDKTRQIRCFKHPSKWEKFVAAAADNGITVLEQSLVSKLPPPGSSPKMEIEKAFEKWANRVTF